MSDEQRRAEAKQAYSEWAMAHGWKSDWPWKIFEAGYLAGDAVLKAERELAERAEADNAALLKSLHEIAKLLVFVEYQTIAMPSVVKDAYTEARWALEGDHPGALLLAALESARAALTMCAKLAFAADGYFAMEIDREAIRAVADAARAALAQLDAAGVGRTANRE